MSENSVELSCDLSAIRTEESAESLATLDRPGGVLVHWRHDEAAAEPLMRPLRIVVIDILAHSDMQVTLTE